MTADRRGDDQEILLRRLGLEVVRGPVLRTQMEGVAGELRAATDALIEEPPDYLVANTGFGMRAWWQLAADWGLAESLTAALSRTRIVARGAKAQGAVRSAGLPVWWRSPVEQLDSVAGRLLEEDLGGRSVAIQLHGEDHPITARLIGAGATVVEVPVYRWAAADAGPASRLIERACAGEIDAVTFTSAPAVRGFVGLAETLGRAEALLRAAVDGMAVVCIGPVCAAAAVEEGFADPLVPERWRLGAMVSLIGRVLADRVPADRLVADGLLADRVVEDRRPRPAQPELG